MGLIKSKIENIFQKNPSLGMNYRKKVLDKLIEFSYIIYIINHL